MSHAAVRRTPGSARLRSSKFHGLPLPLGFVPVEAKLLPPRARPGLLPRQRLVESLVAATGTPVVVSAPAGYGKSTMLTAWAEIDERPFAWLSLDEADDDP